MKLWSPASRTTSGARRGPIDAPSSGSRPGTRGARPSAAWGSWNKGGWPEKGPVEPASESAKRERDPDEDSDEAKLAAELFREAQEEAWSDVRRVLSASELPSDKRMNTLKEAASSLEFDYLEAMENRIQDAARLPSALLPQVARLLAARPPERLPENLKWRQIEGSHYSASVLDLDIQPDVPWLKELRGTDPVHDQTVTAAHGTTWNACYGILLSSLRLLLQGHDRSFYAGHCGQGP